MQKALLILLLCHTFCSASAQKVSFELLDAISTDVSQWQNRTSGKTYKDPSGDEYELSFPGQNFTVWYYDKLATNAVYRKRGTREVLSVTEGIDFSKAIGISTVQDQNGITCFRVDFPKDHLKTQLVEQGKVTATVKESYLDFYCPYGVVDTDKIFLFDKMFFRLYGLAALLKTERGLMKEGDWENEVRDWQNLKSEAFVAKYPNSLLAAQARKNATREKAEREALARNQKVILGYMEQYKYRKGLRLQEFTNYNQEADRIVRKGNYKSYGNSAAYSAIKGLGKPYPEGPLIIALQSASSDIVSSFEHVVLCEKSEQQAMERYQAIRADLQNKLDKRYISQDGENYVFAVPGVARLTLRHMNYNKWHAVSLLFE